MEVNYQPVSMEVWQKKYQLKNQRGEVIDDTMTSTLRRVAKDLASFEKDSDYWEESFYSCFLAGAIPAGRILSNAGAQEHKPSTSLINCTVSSVVEDSIDGIMNSCTESAITLASGAGIGYEFSTLRPKGAFVKGAGACTSGPITFMDIFDKMCFTISSAGGRRGAQMGTFAVWHPDVMDFIKVKREDGRMRQFNLSLLIDDEFMQAVKSDDEWELVFPLMSFEDDNVSTTWRSLFWEESYCEKMGYTVENGKILCKVYSTIRARELWDTIMRSTYDYAEPGFLLIDNINDLNNNYFCEKVRATNPCGEQPLPPYGSCLLGSINLTKFIVEPLSDAVRFDWCGFKSCVRTFTRALDNVVELNGLPLEGQRQAIETKRRHGMGITGLGSALSLMQIKYGSEEGVRFTEEVMKVLAVTGYQEGVLLAKEKGAAPLLQDKDNLRLWVDSQYMSRVWSVWPEGRELALKYGCRFTHHSSIAPTGTISLTYGNNVSNGIEPSFMHEYVRNIIKEGKKSKSAETVYSYEGLMWRGAYGEEPFPEYFTTTEDLTPEQHIDMQAVAQYWCDSSISKTVNVPSDYPYDRFKDLYIYAYEKGLKGCTTFRFNPEAFQGVLVSEEDLQDTMYDFTLEDGEVVSLRGADFVKYDGEEHTAANLYDAIKEGYYGKF